MPHIQMTIEAALRHVRSKRANQPNMFDWPKQKAIDYLQEHQAKGEVFIATESCPTFDLVKGCQCTDNEATERIIKEREDFTAI